MPREQARDSGVSLQGQNKRPMLECIDHFSTELSIRSNGVLKIASSFKPLEAKCLAFVTFIPECDFVQSLLLLTLVLQFFLTTCILVARERSFYKLEIIGSHRGSATGQSGLSDLAILSIERKMTKLTVLQLLRLERRKFDFHIHCSLPL